MLTTDPQILREYTSPNMHWLGIPGIAVTKGGRAYLAFYSGGTGEQIGNFAALLRSEDGVDFGEPIAVCFEEGHRCFDPCVWIDPLGRLWFAWARHPDDGVFAAICDEPDAKTPTFGPEFFIGHNVMLNKPTVLSTGEWAFPLAVWDKGVYTGTEVEAPVRGSFLCATSDGGRHFEMRGGADVPDRSFDEHMFLELPGGVVRVFVRTRNTGIGACDSTDGGYTWGPAFDPGYGGPDSRFHIRRLPSGRVLLINHIDFGAPSKRRVNLAAMLSEDDGRTFPYRLLLDERDDVSYPDADVDAAGRIHIVYDRERYGAKELLTACVTEKDILGGRLTDSGSYLKRVAYCLNGGKPDSAPSK